MKCINEEKGKERGKKNEKNEPKNRMSNKWRKINKDLLEKKTKEKERK